MGKKGNVNLKAATGAIPDIPNGYTPETRTILTRTRIVEVPLVAAPPDAYRARHVDLQLSQPQRKALKETTLGLIAAEKRLANGREIRSNADAIRFILEAIGSEEGTRTD